MKCTVTLVVKISLVNGQLENGNRDGMWMELPPDPLQQQALVFRSVQLLILLLQSQLSP
jgi:hypothetical protein